MPEFTTVHLAILASLFGAGLVLGWWLARNRSAREKLAINAGWQEQLDARQAESDRLVEQNKNLMQQVSDYYATSNDSSNRTRELSVTLRDTLAGREELQRRIRQARENLGMIAEQRDTLRKEFAALREQYEAVEARGAEQERSLNEKDEKIFRLSQQLSDWQSRLAPLVDKFRERDAQATELQAELDRATNRIAELEVLTRPDETQIGPIDQDAVELLHDASNDQYDDTTRQWSAGDDLQQIKGVGPAIEKTLNELGIFRLEQIAGISEYEIDRIAERLRGLRSRIYREDWIGQARSLLYRESPDPA
jgi:predicted flap endonuclease-1-like 5' DNA nuclease/cell division protein FtsB